MRNQNIFHQVIQTGEWWKLDGWKDKKISHFSSFTFSQCREAFEELKDEFSPKWFKDNYNSKRRHPLISYLLTGSSLLPSGNFLIRLGLDLRNIKKIKGGKSLIEAMKRDAENFYSLLDEIRWGSWLYEKKYQVRKMTKEGPDFEIYFDKSPLYLEVKIIEESQIEKFCTHFLLSFLHNEITLPGFETEIILKENFVRDVKFAYTLQEEGEKISFLRTQLETSIFNFKKDVEKKKFKGETSHFKYKVHKSTTTSSGIQLSYLLTGYPEVKIKRKIEEALNQLEQVEGKGRGIVAINYSHCTLDDKTINSLEAYLKLKNLPLILYRSFFKNRIVYKKLILPQKISFPLNLRNFLYRVKKEFN